MDKEIKLSKDSTTIIDSQRLFEMLPKQQKDENNEKNYQVVMIDV